MADINYIIPIIKKLEGGFSNHPNDKGGATNKGVTIATFRSVYGKNKTVQDLKNMTDEQWKYIFKTRFWDKCLGDDINSQSIANIIVDWNWASGSLALKYTQEVLGVKQDGIFGKITLSAINDYKDQEELFKRLWDRRKKHFDNIVKNNPSQKVFYRGWIRRLNEFKYFV